MPIGDLSECQSAVYDGLGGPEESLISSERIFALILKELRLRVAQLSFTDQEIFSVHITDTPLRREQVVPGVGQEFMRPGMAEIAADATDAASGYWAPLPLVSLRALDGYPVHAAAVYFDQTSGQWLYRLNYDPDGVAVIQFWHDPLQVVQMTLAARPNFPTAFNEIIADGATLQGLPELWEGERRLARIEKRKTDTDLLAFINMKTTRLSLRIDEWVKSAWDFYRFSGGEKSVGVSPPFNAWRGGWRATAPWMR